MATAEQIAVIDIPVDFQGVSLGQDTARLGVKINRDHMGLDKADDAFSGHRLAGKVILGDRYDPDQTKFIEDVDVVIETAFDVKRFSVTDSYFSIGLTFSKRDIEVHDLAEFAKKSGRLVVFDIGAIPEDEDGSDDEPEIDESLRAEHGEALQVPLSDLFSGRELKALHSGKLKVVGDFVKFNSREQRLEDLDGCGPKMAERIQDRMTEFWAVNELDSPADDEEDSETE